MLHVDLIVIAGGASRRMGIDKALLPVPPEDTPLLRHIIEQLAGLISGQTIVVANDRSLVAKAGLSPSVHQVPDRYPGAGALGGLATGLGLSSGWSIAVACDMPLVAPALFAWLTEHARSPGEAGTDEDGDPRWDAIVPVTEGYPQPLHALYHRRCLPAIEAMLARRNLRIAELYDAVRVRYVPEQKLRRHDPELRSFFNVNTPQDWQRALALIEQT